MKICFKGDIIQKDVDLRGNKLEWCWGSELVGVNTTVTDVVGLLFYRPIENWLKYFFWWMFNVKFIIQKKGSKYLIKWWIFKIKYSTYTIKKVFKKNKKY